MVLHMAVVAYLPCWPHRPIASGPLRAAAAAAAASWLGPLPLCRTLGRAVVAVASKGDAALTLPPVPSTRPGAPASAVTSCCYCITALPCIVLIAPGLLDGPLRSLLHCHQPRLAKAELSIMAPLWPAPSESHPCGRFRRTMHHSAIVG